MRLWSTAVAAVQLVLLLQACGAGEGGGCSVDEDCKDAFLCFENVCLSRDADPDWDGLPTGAEVLSGSSPLAWDTDHDGIPDGQECGDPGHCPDQDGDGRPDLLESLILDQDGDCVPDQYDPTDGAMPGDLKGAKRFVCRKEGLCRQEWKQLDVQCFQDALRCVMPDGGLVPLVETSCDTLDEDCDGSTDEGFLFSGKSLGDGCVASGTCGSGRVECAPGGAQAICSSGPGGSESKSRPERCNGKDEDCDGLTDEDFLVKGVPPGKPCVAAGVCGGGTVECSPDGNSARCSSGPGGSEDRQMSEFCNNLDDDCDGLTDEDLRAGPWLSCPDVGVCNTDPESLESVCKGGAWTCSPLAGSAFQPGVETSCDYLDNNCDGSADESFSILDFNLKRKKVGEGCGTGPCSGGKVLCGPEGAFCSTGSNASPEICDYLDNDCDGYVDEGLTYAGKAPGESCSGAGGCGVGKVECGAGGGIHCSTDPGGSDYIFKEEDCNGLDDDCDGFTDEKINPALAPCGKEGVCKLASYQQASCRKGKWVCQYPDLPMYQEVETGCDGLDNDCDGFTDEGLPMGFGSDLETVAATTTPPALAGEASIPGEHGIYLVGGNLLSLEGQGLCSDGLWYGDSSGWVMLGTSPVFCRTNAALAVYKAEDGSETLLISGGVGADGEFAPTATVSFGFAGMDIRQLTQLPPEVEQRMDHAVATVDGKRIWLLGGKGRKGKPAGFGLYSTESGIYEVLGFPGLGSFVRLSMCDDFSAVMLTCDGGFPCTLSRISLTSTADYYPLPLPQNFPNSPSVLCIGGLVQVLGHYADKDLAKGRLLAFNGVDWFGTAAPNLSEPMLFWDQSSVNVLGGHTGKGDYVWLRWRSGESWNGVELSSMLPQPLSGAAFTKGASGLLCIYGGLAPGINGPVIQRSLWCYDPMKGWSGLRFADGPPAVNSVMAWNQLRKEFLVVGGSVILESGKADLENPTSQFFAIDPVSASITDLGSRCPQTQPSPCQLSGAALTVREEDGSIWIHGGFGTDGLRSELWRLSADSLSWQSYDLGMEARWGHRMVSGGFPGGYLLLLGGKGGTQSLMKVQAESGTVEFVEMPAWSGRTDGVLFYDRQDEGLFFMAGTHYLFFKQLEFVNQGTLASDSFFENVTAMFDQKSRTGLVFGGLTEAGTQRLGMHVVRRICDQ